ncbi:MAG: hypothetical protein EXR72_07300 [Myxococcales bacterium]|nr:hypothetical protein [Myxococcales bacterium]
MARTKTEAALAEAEREHAGDPVRAELLARARRFKSSWLELAESLSSLRKGGQWKHWGHASFDEYAKKELHLRQETVDKLTGSFLFLQKRAPEVLARDGVGRPIPSYQSVDFLRRAEEREGAPAEAVTEIHRRVIDEAASLPSLARKYKEVVFPLDDDERRERDSAAIRAAARRLHELLDGTEAVPKRLAGEVRTAIERLIEALPEEESEAA